MLFSYTETITTATGGAATVYLGHKIRGRVVAIKYAPGTIATGATLTITGETSEVAVLTKANAGTSTVWYYPVAAAHKVADGGASTLTEVPVCLFQERLKVAVTSGGDAKVGAITLYTDEEQ